jgi:hypothetical protein
MTHPFTFGCIVFVAFGTPAFACTQVESEEKVRDTIYAMSQMQARNPSKAAIARSKIDQALDEALAPTSTPQEMQAATDKLCKAMDEVLAELRR